MSLKVYSGDTELIEIALNDKNFLTVYGILECRKHIMMIHVINNVLIDDGIEKLEKKSQFRKFLTEQIVFKKVVEINNQHILAKIHLNYRINFLYDCILEPIMDEARPSPFTKVCLFFYIYLINFNRLFITTIARF